MIESSRNIDHHHHDDMMMNNRRRLSASNNDNKNQWIFYVCRSLQLWALLTLTTWCLFLVARISTTPRSRSLLQEENHRLLRRQGQNQFHVRVKVIDNAQQLVLEEQEKTDDLLGQKLAVAHLKSASAAASTAAAVAAAAASQLMEYDSPAALGAPWQLKSVIVPVKKSLSSFREPATIQPLALTTTTSPVAALDLYDDDDIHDNNHKRQSVQQNNAVKNSNKDDKHHHHQETVIMPPIDLRRHRTSVHPKKIKKIKKKTREKKL
jgi:hypothetical protein